MPKLLHLRRFLPVLPFLTAFPARATVFRDCSAAGGVDSRFCGLEKYLPTLYALAAILGVILIVVVVLAIAYYRRARHMKLEP